MSASDRNPTPATAAGTRIVIIGGVAGGASAAARLMRLNNKLHVTLIERGPDVSIASCGTPYYIGNKEITDRSELLVHTPSSLQGALGVTRVLVNTEAVAIDRQRKIVVTRPTSSSKAAAVTTPSSKKHDNKNGDDQTSAVPYDFLILATGAAPFIPFKLIGGLSDPTVRPRVMTLRDLRDMDRIVSVVGHQPNRLPEVTTAAEEENKSKSPSTPARCLNVTIVGAGFIGIELAEQLTELGHKVTLLEQAPTVLPICDDEIGAMLHPVLREKGIRLVTNDSLKKIAASATIPSSATGSSPSEAAAQLSLETKKGLKIDANFVILSVGVRAETSLASDCGLKLNGHANQLITVDDFMRTSDHSIYAVGDAVELSDGVFHGVKTWTPLANVASMAARIAADHIVLGTSVPFRGSFNTAIVRCFGTACGTTGWSEKRLKMHKIPYHVSVINGWASASYMKGAKAVLVKITYCPTTGTLFGGQVVGGAGVDKRLDILATALAGKLTIFDLSHTQFSYSPPFGTAKDPITVACLNGRNITFDKLTHASTRLDPNAVVLDVRPKGLFEKDPITLAKDSQPKKHLFWMTSREGAQQLRNEDEEKSKTHATREKQKDGTTTNGDGGSVGDHLAASSLRTPTDPPSYQSLCVWGRTSYFAHRNLVQAGVPFDKVTTLQGGNAYARALKEAERSGSKL